MSEPNYSPEQQEALDSVRIITSRLVEIEELERRVHQPVYDLGCAMDSAVSDIVLDNQQPYHVLERILRTTLQRARDLGLGNDPLIEKVSAIAFS